MPDTADLISAATSVRENAYVPYSGFKVGAAILASDGSVHVGCNVENVAYPEGTCAEAGAIAAMVASGLTCFDEAVVIADSPVPVTPCGGCRQKLLEFANEGARITMANLEGDKRDMNVSDLLPGVFDRAQMDKT